MTNTHKGKFVEFLFFTAYLENTWDQLDIPVTWLANILIFLLALIFIYISTFQRYFMLLKGTVFLDSHLRKWNSDFIKIHFTKQNISKFNILKQ